MKRWLMAFALLCSPAAAATITAYPPGTIPPVAGDTTAVPTLAQVLAGKGVVPGDTIVLAPGTYTGTAPLQVKLQGTEAAPIIIDGRNRAVIRCGIQVVPPATHVVIENIEVTGAGYPTTAGIELLSGDHDIIDHCLVHGNYQGIADWSGAHGTVVKYCTIYGDGAYSGPQAGHGHEVYTQNSRGQPQKQYLNDVIGKGASPYPFHAYGQGGGTSGYCLFGCTFLGGHVLIGGTSIPSDSIKIDQCAGACGADLMLGYGTATKNADCSVTNCVGFEAIEITGYSAITLNWDNAKGLNITERPGQVPAISGVGNVWRWGCNITWPDAIPGGFTPPAIPGFWVGGAPWVNVSAKRYWTDYNRGQGYPRPDPAFGQLLSSLGDAAK